MSRKNKASRRNARRKFRKDDVWYSIENEDNYNENRSDIKRINEYYREEEIKTITKRLNKQVILTPRGDNQKNYIQTMQDPDVFIIFGIGPAGSGKTMLATQFAIKLLIEEKIDKIIITRPAVCADEELGFLPGALNNKMQPFIQPILDIFEEHFTPREVQNMMKEKQLCIEPLAFMRGRTFKRSFIIADEMQNSTPEQMKMLLTRIGEDSHMVVTGDLNQHDRKYDKNGLLDFTNRLNNQNTSQIRVCKFNNSDIQRHPVIDAVLNLYGEQN